MKITVVNPCTSAKEMTTRYISARYNCTPAAFAERLVRELMAANKDATDEHSPADLPCSSTTLGRA